MPDPTDKSRPTQRRSRTLLGAGTRVNGLIEFTGTLQVLGEIHGGVTCPDDAAGTLIVEATGQVTGSAQAPLIVVRGQLVGPMNSSKSIEVDAGGKSVGDASYRTFRVQPGGSVDGLLTRIAIADDDEKALVTDKPVAAKPADRPPRTALKATPEERPARGNRGGTLLIIGVALLIAGATVFMAQRDRGNTERSVALDPSPNPAQQALPEKKQARAEATEPVANSVGARKENPEKATEKKSNEQAAAAKALTSEKADAAAAASKQTEPASTPAPPTPATARPAEHPEPDSSELTSITGVTPGKPTALVYIITKAPAVLYKKKRTDASRGTRLEFGKGRNTGIRISPDEILRVAVGESLDLYYQGGKVVAEPISSGAWMQFVPVDAGEAAVVSAAADVASPAESKPETKPETTEPAAFPPTASPPPTQAAPKATAGQG